MLSLIVATLAGEVPADRHHASLAVDAHLRCKARDAVSCADARRLYEAFLTEHPADAISSDMRFFLAELDYDTFNDFETAAPLYRQVAVEGGRHQRQARYDYVLALDELRQRARRASSERTAWDSALLAACDWYVQVESDSVNAPKVALRAASLALDLGSPSDAERRWSDLRRRWPGTDEAGQALRLWGRELEAERAVRRLAALSREVRADHALVAVDAFLARWPATAERGHALLVSAMLNQRLGRSDAAQARLIEASHEPEPAEPAATHDEPSEGVTNPEEVQIE